VEQRESRCVALLSACFIYVYSATSSLDTVIVYTIYAICTARSELSEPIEVLFLALSVTF